ncbi:hypothetical protein EK21DRAFT_67328, partial [Setomelanomma holmii]
TVPSATSLGYAPPATGKITSSAIILLVFGGIIEFWIVFALIFAAVTRDSGQPYLDRVRNVLKFQLR